MIVLRMRGINEEIGYQEELRSERPTYLSGVNIVTIDHDRPRKERE